MNESERLEYLQEQTHAEWVQESASNSTTNRTELMRERTADTFPMPDQLPSLMYADTEFGEMLDAMLRVARPDDKRNNGREHDPVAEFGQLVVMLRTAEMQYRSSNAEESPFSDELIRAMIAYHESMADLYLLQLNGGSDEYAWYFVDAALGMLADVIGTTVEDAERLACERFEAKHAVKQVAA